MRLLINSVNLNATVKYTTATSRVPVRPCVVSSSHYLELGKIHVNDDSREKGQEHDLETVANKGGLSVGAEFHLFYLDSAELNVTLRPLA